MAAFISLVVRCGAAAAALCPQRYVNFVLGLTLSAIRS